MEVAATRALDQIKHKYYAQELRSLGIQNIKAIGIAFLGKKLLVKSEDLKA